MRAELAANIEAVRQRMEAAAQRAGRAVDDISLVAVTKTQPVETVIAAYQVGLRHFGENRAEESLEKSAGFSDWLKTHTHPEPVYWHFIGHVQSRQAGLILTGHHSLIHSVDSLKLAQRLNRLAKSSDDPPLEILLQCNVSGERTKSGFELDRWVTDEHQLSDFFQAVRQVAGFEKLTVRGLMAMAPFSDDPETARPTFKSLAALRNRLQAEFPQLDWRTLSMGMSDDYEIAIEEGATMIRVGRAIFGERIYI